MRKFWTRVAALVAVVVVAFSFAACALFTEDLDKKYSPNRMVITAADSDIAISRQDLYYAYLSWGKQYVNYFETVEDLMDYIGTSLLNQQILQRTAVDKFGELRVVEAALARKMAFDSLDSAIQSFVADALKLPEEEHDHDHDHDHEDADSDAGYQKIINVDTENGLVFTLNLDIYQDTDSLAGDYGDLATQIFVDNSQLGNLTTYVPTVSSAATEKTVRQAIAKVVRNLQSVENGFKKLPKPEIDYLQDSPYFAKLDPADRDVLNRELNRIIKTNETSILASRWDTAYQLGLVTLDGQAAFNAWNQYLLRGLNWDNWVASVNGVDCQGRSVATTVANKAVNYYLEKVEDAINAQKNFPNDDMIGTLMASDCDLNTIYYVPTAAAENLFTVSHILIGFTDEQKTEYERIQEEAKRNPNYDANADLQKLYAATCSNDESASDIYLQLTAALKDATSLDERYQIFRNFIRKYNTDPGMNRLVNNNTDEDDNSNTVKAYYEYLMTAKGKNSMIEPFTNASLELFKAGEKGAISGLVWGQYGAHIIMYTRDLADFIYTGAAGAEDATIASLHENYADTLFTPITAYGTQSRFDTIVASYFKRNYDRYQNDIIEEYQEAHTITKIKSEFKNFL